MVTDCREQRRRVIREYTEVASRSGYGFREGTLPGVGESFSTICVDSGSEEETTSLRPVRFSARRINEVVQMLLISMVGGLPSLLQGLPWGQQDSTRMLTSNAVVVPNVHRQHV